MLCLLLALVFLVISSSYGISVWYALRHRHEPLQIGTTFIPNYARYFGLDPKDTMAAMINDLGFKRMRLVTYWNIGEASQGSYDFSEFDWQFKMAEDNNVKVALSIGLRQPRWPECHMPGWAEDMPMSEWYPHLKRYMAAVIDRYKNSPVLESYQLENEYLMTIFGICPDHSRHRIIDEYQFVKQLDPHHPVVITRSNNWGGVPLYPPTPDQFGVAVYKRVWDQTLTKRYFEYPYPAWFYGYLAGAGEIVSGKSMIIHELQAEPWMPVGFDLASSTLEEQDKSMNADRLRHRIKYGVDTGIRTIDLWGAEWWYWRKVKHGDPSLWDAARQSLQHYQSDISR